MQTLIKIFLAVSRYMEFVAEKVRSKAIERSQDKADECDNKRRRENMALIQAEGSERRRHAAAMKSLRDKYEITQTEFSASKERHEDKIKDLSLL